jgi:hypothetical protein
MKTDAQTQAIRNRKWLLVASLAFAVTIVTGCTSSAPVAEGASAAMNQQALSFSPPTGCAGVYVVRPRRFEGRFLALGVDLDSRRWGSLGTDSYLYGVVAPGKHAICPLSGGHRPGQMMFFTVAAGKNYYLEAIAGMPAQMGDTPLPNARFVIISETAGQSYVRKFKLSGDNIFEGLLGTNSVINPLPPETESPRR